MSRIPTPADIASAPAASQPLLEGVKKQLGSAPNLFRLVGNSPAALEGYLGLLGALGKGTLGAKTGARIAVAVANVNGCGYCNSAHTYLGKNLAKLDEAELAANRTGRSGDPKADAAVRFAVKIVKQRGHVGEDGFARGQGGGLFRRATCRDRRPCRAEHADQLRQRSLRHGN